MTLESFTDGFIGHDQLAKFLKNLEGKISSKASLNTQSGSECT
jgi:hypothetical protein